MGLIKRQHCCQAGFRAPFFLALGLGGILASGLWAEEPLRTSYAAEIRELEGKIAAGNLPPQELRKTRERLALLFQFSGNIEGAAASWVQAGALLRAAQCFAAIGEWTRADEAVKSLLASARDRALILRTRYLGAQIDAFRSGGGDYAMLASFLNDPDYAAYKAQTCYFLWKFSGNPEYKTMLIQEYPGSPEARIAQGSGAAAPTTLWLLYPGGESPPAQPATAARVQDDTAARPQGVSPAEQQAGGSQGPAFIQVGLYGREENARIQAERLRSKDFSPSIIERTVNGNRYWAVTIAPGNDYNHLILRLKDAGFESFPVF
jgi:hypothetical protein